MSYSDKESHSGSKQRWIDDTHRARRDAEQVRREIPPTMVHTAPYDVPQLVDYYNRMLFEYASHIRPHRDVVPGKWKEVLGKVRVPKDGEEVELGRANSRGELPASQALAQAPTEHREVSLANLRDRWMTDNLVTVTVRFFDPWQGDRIEHISKVLYLPVYAGDKVRDQLNDCVEDIGWLPDPSSRDLEDNDEDDLIEPESFRR